MFGLIEKMDKFSNKKMTEDEKIDFLEEIVENGMVWDMHQKYINSALFYMKNGLVVDMVLRRKPSSEVRAQ